jgi:hypothetical protein
VMRRIGGFLLAVVVSGVALVVLSGTSGAASSTYTTVEVPTPPGTGYSSLNGISCPSAGNCVAVGTASAEGGYDALVETLTGGTWTPTEFNQGLPSPVLNGIWCATLSSCIAVGLTNATSNMPSALIETWAGATWTPMTSGLSPGGAVTTTLNAISCVSSTSCVATGSYTDSGGDTHALFESLSGGTWTPATAVDPAGATSLGVQSVQCFAATSCFAVGYWGPNDTTSNGLLETLSGSTWTASTIQYGVDLRSLWCASSTSCIGVGYGPDGNSVTETLSGTTWGSAPLPGIGDGGTGNGVVGISCASDITSCVAIGGWRPPGSSYPYTLVETLSNGTWTANELSGQTSPPPLFPEGIACPTITTCVGVGQSVGSPAYAEALMPPHGYWLVGSDGGIFSFGSAVFHGSMGGIPLQRPVVGIVPTADLGGYWLDASDGGVFAFGDTRFYGSIPGLGLNPAGSGQPHSLNAPIVGMVPSHDQGGYFMVGSDGGVFAFGDAHFAGSCPGIGGCSGAAVAVMPDASGNGYWLVTKSGNVYTFGDAPYFGGPGLQGSPITSAVATPDGGGYYILDADGQVFAYGDADSSLGNVASGTTGGLNPATAIFATADNGGYWVADALGKVFTFGDAPGDGDMSGTHLNGPIIAASGS